MLLGGLIALRGHRGGRPDALNVSRVAGIAKAADEERDIRPLAAPVGVQFVEHEELEVPGRLDQVPFLGPGKDQFEHHVVGQQDVRRVRDDPGPVLRRFLTGVPVEADWRAVWVADRQELPQLAELAVGKGVHRIDHDRLDPRPVRSGRLGRQHPVDDRDDVREALPGAGPGRQDVVVPGVRRLDGFPLMLMQPQHRAVKAVILETEDLLAFRLEQSLGYQVGDRPA